MGLFKMPKKKVGLISGRPKGKDILSPQTLARGLALGLEKGGYATAKGVMGSKKIVSKALQPRFKIINVKQALKQDKERLKKHWGKAPQI